MGRKEACSHITTLYRENSTFVYGARQAGRQMLTHTTCMGLVDLLLSPWHFCRDGLVQ